MDWIADRSAWKEEQGLQSACTRWVLRAGRGMYIDAFPLLYHIFSISHHIHIFFQFITQEFLNISFEHSSIHRISAIMASSGKTTAVAGGTGTQSTPANNVGETRRVRLLVSLLVLIPFLYRSQTDNSWFAGFQLRRSLLRPYESEEK